MKARVVVVDAVKERSTVAVARNEKVHQEGTAAAIAAATLVHKKAVVSVDHPHVHSRPE